MKFQVKTGSEFHTTERRGAMVSVDGKAIYEILKASTQEWEMIGTKGRHGKWCIAEYEIPEGSKVTFKAAANGKPSIEHSFTVGENLDDSIDFEGYKYGGDICGWIVKC